MKIIPELIQYLENLYGIPEKKPSEPAIDILIRTILSQNTNDRNRDRAFKNLKNRFKKWEDLLKTNNSVIEKTISPCGLGRQKTLYIKNALKFVKKKYGMCDIEHLKHKSVNEIRDEFKNVKGIGPRHYLF